MRLAEPSELGGAPPERNELNDEEGEDAEHAEGEGIRLGRKMDVRGCNRTRQMSNSRIRPMLPRDTQIPGPLMPGRGGG